jgi:hypothetical protein
MNAIETYRRIERVASGRSTTTSAIRCGTRRTRRSASASAAACAAAAACAIALGCADTAPRADGAGDAAARTQGDRPGEPESVPGAVDSVGGGASATGDADASAARPTGTSIPAEPPDAPRVLRSDSAGVEIVTVETLPALDDTTWQWRLTLVREIAGRGTDPGDPVVLYDPRSAARFDDGTLVVFDDGPQRIVLIDADADTVLARFATTGQGPGEIRGDGVVLLPGPGDTLTVVELWGNRRIHRFSRTGRLLSETPLPVGFSAAQAVGPTHDDIAAAYFQPAAGGYVDIVGYIDLRTGAVRSFTALPERVPAPGNRQPLFHPISLWGAIPGGGAVIGMTDGGTFRYHDEDGVVRREIRLPMTAREVTRESAAEALEGLAAFTAGVAAEPSPERIHSHHRIAFRIEAVGDSLFALVHKGRSSPAEDPVLGADETAWRLYHVTGVPAGVIRFPVGFTPWHVRAGHLFGVYEDSLGGQALRVYTLDPPAGR